MVPPCSDRVSRAPPYSSCLTGESISHTGLSPSMAGLSRPFCYAVTRYGHRAVPRSLVATERISVDFFSSGYLDISVPRVRLHCPMYSGRDTAEAVGFPIRTSPDQSLFASSPKLIAGYYVLHRLLSPRHPPCALIHLTI